MTDNHLQKRLVIVVGDKGGVGKTTFSRGLLQLYINNNIPCIAYDADSRNPQLQRYYRDYHKGIVRFVDFFARGAADDLLIDLEKENFPIYLLDLPAQSGGFFESYVKELSFFKILESEINCKVTMVSVISRVLDSVNLLEYLYNYCQDQVDYVVVKNLFHGAEEKFERYDDSNLRHQLKEKGLIETVMPDMFYKPYDFLDRYSLTFNQALNHSESNIVIKARISAWLGDFEERTKPAANLLGLNFPPASGHYEKMLQSKAEIEINEVT
ncbi:chromosome partitioning protein ParA [Chlorogloea sp. CCALA 695]|nr:chromosome partitioning protein ParA [Chlorogloea sp. CCALA 695]